MFGVWRGGCRGLHWMARRRRLVCIRGSGCDHPVYNHCTLFLVGERGLAVIQQRYDPETKHTFWAEVDEWLTDPLYLHPRFRAFFDRRAGTGTDGLYPTVTLRQIMWALKMKPLPKQPWETVFDHTPI